MNPLQTNTSECLKGTGYALATATCGMTSCVSAVMTVALPICLLVGIFYGLNALGCYIPAGLPQELTTLAITAVAIVLSSSAMYCGKLSKASAEATQHLADATIEHFRNLEPA